MGRFDKGCIIHASGQGRESELTSGWRCAISSLLLVVLRQTGNEVGLVAGVGKAPFTEQLLQLGDLHRVVVGHGKGDCAVAAQKDWRDAKIE